MKISLHFSSGQYDVQPNTMESDLENEISHGLRV